MIDVRWRIFHLLPHLLGRVRFYRKVQCILGQRTLFNGPPVWQGRVALDEFTFFLFSSKKLFFLSIEFVILSSSEKKLSGSPSSLG